MDEQRAIQLCLQHRDPIGFEFLVQKYRREAFFHAYQFLGNPQDALDACQDSFARAFAAIPRLEALTEFYPWFYRILRNRCLNLLARQQTSQRYAASQAAGFDAGDATEPPSPRGALEQGEAHEQLRAALASLEPELREILTLKYLQDRSYADIATLLDIPRGTVMSRLYRARIALRDACAHPRTRGPQTLESSR
jgi:RNA polymerase sigma-70 factor (ECF subfamily)